MQNYGSTVTRSKRRRGPGLVFTVFMLFGLVFFLVGCFTLWSDYKFKQTALKTTATITDIKVRYDSDGEASHTVYVAFIVDNRAYEGRLNYYSSSMYIGKEIGIFYNPANPNHFRGAGGYVLGVIFAALGLIFILIGLVPKVIFRRRSSRNDYLLANGRKLNAKLVEVYQDTRISVNSRHPYKVVCQGPDHTGQMREFKSENLWRNPRYLLEDLKIKSLPVYIDENKPHKYYLDVRKLYFK